MHRWGAPLEAHPGPKVPVTSGVEALAWPPQGHPRPGVASPGPRHLRGLHLGAVASAGGLVGGHRRQVQRPWAPVQLLTSAVTCAWVPAAAARWRHRPASPPRHLPAVPSTSQVQRPNVRARRGEEAAGLGEGGGRCRCHTTQLAPLTPASVVPCHNTSLKPHLKFLILDQHYQVCH